MTRIFGDYAYSDGPRAGCWWDGTADIPACAPLDGDVRADVVIIGGGFTGLIAAVHLAEAGACVVLLEAQHIGWGASGRNGGFCCLGGGKLSDDAFDRRYGKAARLAFRHTEVDAVNTVAGLTQQYRIDVDRHSHGETMLAHRPKDVERFEEDTRAIRENYNVKPAVLSA
ncbi:MAG: FAD-binding oxidoreductase, partial [Pseudomonadota bacterium]